MLQPTPNQNEKLNDVVLRGANHPNGFWGLSILGSSFNRNTMPRTHVDTQLRMGDDDNDSIKTTMMTTKLTNNSTNFGNFRTIVGVGRGGSNPW